MFLKSLYEKIFKQEKGAILAMTAVMIPIMFGFAGLAYDVGNLYMQKGRLQHIADSAAYAGSSVYYRDMIDNSIPTLSKPNADYVVNNEGTGVNQVSETHNLKRREVDNVATEYINKNRPGLQSQILAIEGQVPIKSDNASNTTTKLSDGVLYRVRVSEDFPLYFLPIIPGVAKTQTVSADAVVAFTRGDTTSATEQTHYQTEYVNIFKNLFTTTNLSTGSLNGNQMDFAGDENLKPLIKDQVQAVDVLDQFSYMIYLDNKSTSTPVNHTSITLNAGNSNDNFNSNYTFNTQNKNYNSTLNGYYHPWNCWVTSMGQTTKYENRQYHADVYLDKKLGKNEKYTININKRLNDYIKKGGEYVPFYLYKRYAGDIVINVNDKNANTNENCFPLIIVNRNQYIGPDYNETTSTNSLLNEKIEVNIAKDKVFRGLIFAPYSTVTVNITQGKFKGSIVANKVIVNGSGTFVQENYFVESDGSDAWWIKSFIPESSDKPYLNADGTGYNASTSVLLNYFFNTHLKNMTYNLARRDENGNALSTWYTHAYETLKVGGNYSNGFGYQDYYGNIHRTDKVGGSIDLTVSGTQNWFENLDTLSKARLAREWVNFIENNKGSALTYRDAYGNKHYYRDENGEKIRVNDISLPWIWSTNAEIEKNKDTEEEEVIKSYMMISSDSNNNLFKKFNL